MLCLDSLKESLSLVFKCPKDGYSPNITLTHLGNIKLCTAIPSGLERSAIAIGCQRGNPLLSEGNATFVIRKEMGFSLWNQHQFDLSGEDQGLHCGLQTNLELKPQSPSAV